MRVHACAVTSNLPFKSMKKQLCRFFCERVLSQWLNPLRALIFHIFHGARHGSQINLSTGTAPLTAIPSASLPSISWRIHSVATSGDRTRGRHGNFDQTATGCCRHTQNNLSFHLRVHLLI